MYGSTATITDLCMNVKQGLSAAQIEAAARWGDATIDGLLGARFSWPYDTDGNAINDPPPAIIVEIANLYAAYRLETRFFAQNEAGGITTNPYALRLKKDADDMLKGILCGNLIVKELEADARVRSQEPETVFRTVGSPKISSSEGFRRRTYTRS